MSRAFLDLHSPPFLWSHVSLSCTLPGWCLWSHVVCTPPALVVMIWAGYPPTAPWERRAARWRRDWSCCCSRDPQIAPKGLFLFEKILLLSPATPSKEGPVLSLSPPLQLDPGLSTSGPDTAQFSILLRRSSKVSGVFTTLVLIPLPVTSR